MKLTPAREHVTNKWCLTCRHHGSYHRLITRDKWKQAGSLIKQGSIPWFCEYPTSDEEDMEGLCGCTEFVPTEEGGII